MGSRKTGHHHKKRTSRPQKAAKEKVPYSAEPASPRRLEIVLKCDTSGCVEAIISAIHSLTLPGVEIQILSSGVGAISKSDIFMAETGSSLILGFNVGLMPHIEQMVLEHNVEVRLYEVIYKLIEDLEMIAVSLVPQESVEEIIGSAKVIALFKSSRKGIILGCEVLTGKLALGQTFRVLGAMGSLYTGTIESLHIEKDVVREASKGQQVGLKINDFNKAKIGDLVESFKSASGKPGKSWQPQGRIYYP